MVEKLLNRLNKPKRPAEEKLLTELSEVIIGTLLNRNFLRTLWQCHSRKSENPGKPKDVSPKAALAI